jgi:hypothetical protein
MMCLLISVIIERCAGEDNREKVCFFSYFYRDDDSEGA